MKTNSKNEDNIKDGDRLKEGEGGGQWETRVQNVGYSHIIGGQF